MTRFSRFSTDQAKSPMRRAPTTRPEPFSVWKARRTRASDSRSAGFSAHSGIQAADGRDLLARFLDEEREQFRIDGRAALGRVAHRGRRSGARAVRRRSVGCGAARAAAASTAARMASSATRQRSALSSMYQGSPRPACSVSM